MNYAISFDDHKGHRVFVEGDTILECVEQIGKIETEGLGGRRVELSFWMTGIGGSAVSASYAISETPSTTLFTLETAHDDYARTLVCDFLIEHRGATIFKDKNAQEL